MTDLTNEIPGMVFQVRRQSDGKYAVTYASAGAQAICGLSAMQLMQDAEALTAIVHPDDRVAFIDSFQLSAEQLTPWHLEFRVQVPGREVAWCQGEACPRREEDGSVIWHGFMTDLTERKQIEALGMKHFLSLGYEKDRSVATIDNVTIDLTKAAGNEDWVLYFYRGICHEQSKDCAAAESDFRR